MSSWTIWQRTENYPFAKENPSNTPIGRDIGTIESPGWMRLSIES